jgi:hypothetical protein
MAAGVNYTERKVSFGDVGAWMSFLLAGGMAIWMLRQQTAVQQVRARLYIGLAVLDALAGLFYGVANDGQIGLPVKGDGTGNVLEFVANFFAWTSFQFTCCIAFHVYYVLQTGIVANCKVERQLEKLYWAWTFVTMGCCFLPAGLYLYLIDGQHHDDGYGRYYIILVVYLLAQWVWVAGVCLHLYLVQDFHPSIAQKEVWQYRRQVASFLGIFLAVTAQNLVFLTWYATGTFPTGKQSSKIWQSNNHSNLELLI